MATNSEHKPPKSTGVRSPQGPRKDDKRAQEALREQSKTEVEERPYLDTEGGE